MSIMILILKILSAFAGSLALLFSIPLFFAFRWPAAAMWGLKLFVSALSPVGVLVGLITAIVGRTTGSPFISLIGILVLLIYVIHMVSVTRPPAAYHGFEQAFGPDWENRIPPERKKYFLSRRTVLNLPDVPQPRLEQNISYAMIPGTSRSLLCDVWQPPEGVVPTGLAMIYLHGSAFYLLDKDYGTRPLFKHLAAQGHVIMDVAYRLAPETNIPGMVHDTMRAIVWMKDHASHYRIDPDRILISGGSAGAHLAMLAAYAADEPDFTPDELKGKDFSVCAVVSVYGSNDLQALYYHTRQDLMRKTTGRPQKKASKKITAWIMNRNKEDNHRLGFDKSFENTGALAPLLGCYPDECPERYAKFSPVSHVHKNCPPTLLIHGEHDILAPVATTRYLYKRLTDERVPAVLHILPQTDHGFDLIFPEIAPAAHNAIYDVERFVALMAVGKEKAREKQSSAKMMQQMNQ